MKIRAWLGLMTALISISSGSVSALCTGKVDVGVAHIQSDVISCGTSTKKLEMWGTSANAFISLYKAFVLRPSLIIAGGDADYWNVGMGTGLYLPVTETFAVIPGFGGSFSEVEYHDDINAMLKDKRHRMSSESAWIGVDVSWYITQCLSVSGAVQYGWTDTKSVVDLIVLPTSICHTSASGFNYLGQVDYFFCDRFSVNFSVAHFSCRDDESTGSDAMAYRAGIGTKF